MAVHIFWDNSNIWINLCDLCEKTEGVPRAALRVSIERLHDFVVRGRSTGVKFVVGTNTDNIGDVLKKFQALGYITKFFTPVPDGDASREQAVDGNLQLQMCRTLHRDTQNEVIALLTGDSSTDPDSNTSFLDFIEIALCKGWTVEVYAIKGSLSEAAYHDLCGKYPQTLIITYLDDVYREITFINEGQYYFNGDKTNLINVERRNTDVQSW